MLRTLLANLLQLTCGAHFAAPKRCRLRLSSIPRGAHPARQGFLLYRDQYFHASQQRGISYRGTKCASHTLANLLQLKCGAHFAAPERCRLRLSSIPRGAHPARQGFLLYRNQYFHTLQQHGISYRAKKERTSRRGIHSCKHL